jgi:hypothetical protein
MAESYQIFTGLSGASSVTFNKHFISGDHLSVEDDGVVLASSAYTVVPTGSYPYSAATINFDPAVSGTIKVVRNTPVPAGALNKDFSDGSVLKQATCFSCLTIPGQSLLSSIAQVTVTLVQTLCVFVRLLQQTLPTLLALTLLIQVITGKPG